MFEDLNEELQDNPISWVLVVSAAFWVGAVLTVSVGILHVVHAHAYLGSLPNSANSGHCGMGIIGGWMIVFFGWPFGGAIGAFVSSIYLATRSLNRR